MSEEKERVDELEEVLDGMFDRVDDLGKAVGDLWLRVIDLKELLNKSDGKGRKRAWWQWWIQKGRAVE